MQVLVIGAGVSGLSCALRLAEAGQSVDIWAREMPQQTTSTIAAALWYPYLAEPMNRVLPWSTVTFQELVRLAGEPETGVIMRDGCEIFRTPQPNEAWWASAVQSYRRATANELPAGYADGYFASVPIIDMSIYLGWLERETRALGVGIFERTIQDLRETRGASDVVINCTGVSSREVCNDTEVYGVRGQVQIVRAPHVTRFYLDDEGPSYIIPRVNDVVLGGTAEENRYDTTVSLATADKIRQRCVQLEPGLANASVIANKVGIRPCRTTVRLEAETIDGIRVIHNYGHGGSGITLSWGCAEEVVKLVTA